MENELLAENIKGGLTTNYIGQEIHYFPLTSSTQDEAIIAAENHAPEGTVTIAHEQTSGRGRFNRKWIAPPGSTLLLSIILRPDHAVLPQVVMISALAVARAIEETIGEKPSIKWPNDVLLFGKKVCGILVESASSPNGDSYCISGIGVNINLDVMDFSEIAETATSLHLHTNEPLTRLEVAQRLLNAFEFYYEKARNGAPIINFWKDQLDTIGQRVSATLNEGTVITGTAESVDKQGSLQIRLDNGHLENVVAGDVTLK